MNEPRRWRDDPNAPAELQRLLESRGAERKLDASTRRRVERNLVRLSAVPLSAAAWLSVKSAAALGVAAGVTTAGVAFVVERELLSEPPASRSVEQRPAVTSTARKREPRPAPPAAPPPIQALNPHVEPPRSPAAPPAASGPRTNGGLAEESLLLERARQALGGAPERALALTREHAARFPNAQLGAERNLIEIEALARSGRRAEARALGERLLARSTDDLYAERVRRLLSKPEGP